MKTQSHVKIHNGHMVSHDLPKSLEYKAFPHVVNCHPINRRRFLMHPFPFSFIHMSDKKQLK